MYWCQVVKARKKTALTASFYIALYFALTWLISPVPLLTYLPDEFKIRKDYVLLFLWSSESAPLPNVEDLGVNADKRCERCFVTSNKDFMPLEEFDAILLHGFTVMPQEGRVPPDKQFVLNASAQCISAKFKNCDAFDLQHRQDICGLCEHVRKNRILKRYLII